VNPAEIHLWAFDLDLPETALARLEPLLSDEEQSRAAELRSAARRARFVAGRGMLRDLLGSYTGEDPARIGFRYGNAGKPELAGGGALRFSFSHSGALAVCAVASGRAVGVDVERVRDGIDTLGIAERFFSAREAEQLRELPGPERRTAFFRCWTRKEAYQKAIGRGVFSGLADFEVSVTGEGQLVSVGGRPDEAGRWRLCDLSPRGGHVGAVIAEGADWRPCWQSVSSQPS
jgi:4'-phosphopantetheinyl transferase